MRNSLEIFLWNINGRTGRNEYTIPVRVILEQIEKNKRPSIVVLTELVKYALGYCELKDALCEMGYYVACSEYFESQKQVLIAINSCILNKESISCESLPSYIGMKCNNLPNNVMNIEIEKIKTVPDYLKVSVDLFGKKLSLIGCRIKTGGENLKENYDDEAVQFFSVLIPEIKKTCGDYIIVCGDFNNARYKGLLKEKFEIVKDKYQGCAQYNYNLHRIKDAFSDMSLEMVDKAKPTYKYISDDHIFAKGLKYASCKEPDWSFICRKNGYNYNGIDEWKNDSFADIEGLPDHAFLVASIEL